jgi:hypothetical protein
MPRNVVTLQPRTLVLPTRKNREARQEIVARLGERYRARRQEDGALEIDFPVKLSRRAAKDQVVSELEEIDPRWRRLFTLYPTESSLLQKGE